MIADETVAARVLLAVALGAALGFERELRDQPAGLRTHILVSLGACLFTLVSAYGFSAFGGDDGDAAVRVDVTRVASQIVVGIGFLGGGAILRHGTEIRGLTTAASLWVAAAAGLACGVGFTFGAWFTTLITVLCLSLLKPLERRFTRFRREHPSPDENGG